MLGALDPRAPGGAPPLPPVVAILVVGRALPTRDRSVPALADWKEFAAANGFTRSQPSWPNSSASSRRGRTLTPAARRRRCAMLPSTRRAWPSQLEEVPSSGRTDSDATIESFRRGSRRMKHAVQGLERPMFRSEIPAPDLSQDPGPSSQPGSRAGDSRPCFGPGAGRRGSRPHAAAWRRGALR